MAKKAGATRAQKGNKSARKPAPVIGETEKNEVEPSGEGRLRSVLKLAHRSKGKEKQGAENLPTKPKEVRKVPVKGKSISAARTPARPKSQGQPLKEMGHFFTSTWAELKKVHWPNLKETVVYTVVVIGSVVLVALLIWIADSLLGQLMSLVLK